MAATKVKSQQHTCCMQHMLQEEITCTEVETMAASLAQPRLAAHHRASHRQRHHHQHPRRPHHPPHHYHHHQQEKQKRQHQLLRAGHLPQKAIDPISGQTMDQQKRNHKSVAKSRDQAKNHLTILARSAGAAQWKKLKIYLALIRKSESWWSFKLQLSKVQILEFLWEKL